MGLVWKPHEFSLWKLVPDIADGVLVRSDWVETGSMSGLLIEKTPKEVRDLIEMDCTNPAVVLLDVGDGLEVEQGDRLELDGVFYRVAARPQIHAMGLATDHARLIVEKLG